MKTKSVIAALVLALVTAWEFYSSEPKLHEAPHVSPHVAAQTQAGPRERAPAAASVQAPATLQAEPRNLVKQLYATRACYESQTCDFPNTDPRAYDFAVGRQLAADLAAYRASAPTNEERAKIAREFVNVEDGFVREQVLALFEGLPPSEENLAAISDSLRLNADPDLVKQALPLLEAYVGTPFESGVHELLRGMLMGPQFAAVETSLGLSNFVNDASYAGYEHIVEGLPATSAVGKNLRALLRDYELRQGAG